MESRNKACISEQIYKQVSENETGAMPDGTFDNLSTQGAEAEEFSV